MQNKKTIYFLSDCQENIKTINNINFTPREIEIIACLINARGTSRIASFLSLSPKTVVNHIRNIMVKLGCNSRESIIDFIEKSNKQSLFRIYYSKLVLESAFKDSLKTISKWAHTVPPYSLIYWKTQESKRPFLEKLKDYLELAGVKVHIEMRNAEPAMIYLKNESNDENYRLYVMPVSLYNTEHSISFEKLVTGSHQIAPKFLFLFVGKTSLEAVPHEWGNVNCIDFTEEANYYFSVLELLKKLFVQANLESLIIEFKTQYELINESPAMEIPQERLSIKKRPPFLSRVQSFAKERKLSLLVGGITAISVLSIVFFALKGIGGKELTIADSTSKQSKFSIRSDLILPSKSTLLNRPELLTQIDEKFKGQEGIQSIAIIGIGGSGKTTLARHYAHQQNANIIWEINAETSTSLIESFEKLAQVLSKTDHDQKILRELQEIKDFSEREEKIICFVKERLRLQKAWLLIYDNVEHFPDIQKYFPQDTKTWGEGKVILTTRNHNIQNSRHVNRILLIGELNPQEKFSLFMQIIGHGEKAKLTANHKEETIEFLKKISPFPLDISIAADYLKTTKISYVQYSKYLNQQDKNFIDVQENIRKEAGEYIQTRYSIITLSLEKIIATNKEFTDLLLFISLLDSQDIPRDLLDDYKGKLVVDNFIYHLKKYSLITVESSIPLIGSTLSLHRSTQAISISYIIKKLKLEKHSQSINTIENIFKNYIRNMIAEENFSKMKHVTKHIENFLNKINLFSYININRKSIKGDLGGIYFYLGYPIKAKQILKDFLATQHTDYIGTARALTYLGITYKETDLKKAKILFEKSLLVYKKSDSKDYTGIAKTLTYLGGTYELLEEYKKAKHCLEQSLLIYEKHFPENKIGIARVFSYLGIINKKMGYYEESKEFFEKSLSIYREKFENHFGVTQILTHLSNTYLELGDFKKVEALLKESLSISKKNFSYHRVNIAWIGIYLGNIYIKLGKYISAIDILEETLSFFMKNPSENYFRIGETQRYLGIAYENLGNGQKSKRLLEESLIAYEKRYSKKHSETAETRMYLANTYRKLGYPMKAKTLLKENLKFYNEHGEKYNLKIAHTTLQLGAVCKDLGCFEDAKYSLEKSYTIYKKHYGKKHIETARVLQALGETYFLWGNTKIAEEKLHQALAIFQKNKHVDTYMISENLSDLYLKKSFYEYNKGNSGQSQNFKGQANASLKQALKILITHFPEDSPHTARIQNKLKKLKQGY